MRLLKKPGLIKTSLVALAAMWTFGCSQNNQDNYITFDASKRFVEQKSALDEKSVLDNQLEKLSQEMTKLTGKEQHYEAGRWLGTPFYDYLRGDYFSVVNSNPEKYIHKFIFTKKQDELIAVIQEVSPNYLVNFPSKETHGTVITNPVKDTSKQALVNYVRFVDRIPINDLSELVPITKNINDNMYNNSFYLATRSKQRVPDFDGKIVSRRSPGLDTFLVGYKKSENYNEGNEPQCVNIEYNDNLPNTKGILGRVMNKHLVKRFTPNMLFNQMKKQVAEEDYVETYENNKWLFHPKGYIDKALSLQTLCFENGTWVPINQSYEGTLFMTRQNNNLVLDSVFHGG